jgi:hypothetical protein
MVGGRPSCNHRDLSLRRVSQVARAFNFERWVEDGIYTYRHVARDGPVVEKNWPGLFEEWPDVGPTPYTEFVASGDNCEEVAVYLGLIWRLTRDLMLFGVPRWHRNAGMQRVGAPYALIDWEYDVENEEGPDLGTIRGFVPARSSVRRWPPPGPWEREHADKAGFFELDVFDVFRDVLKGLMSDARAEFNLYALSNAEMTELLAAQQASQPLSFADMWEAVEALASEPPLLAKVTETLAALQGAEPPRLASLLGPGEMLIDLSLGIDMGYADVIVIHSTTDLSELLDPLVQEYEAAVAGYERDVEAIKSMPEFIQRMHVLLNL